MNDALMPSAERLYFWNGLPEKGGYGDDELLAADTTPEAARSSVAAVNIILSYCLLTMLIDEASMAAGTAGNASGQQRRLERKADETQARSKHFLAKLPELFINIATMLQEQTMNPFSTFP